LPARRRCAKLKLDFNGFAGGRMTSQILAMVFVQLVAAGLGGYALTLWFLKARNLTVIGFHAVAGLAGIETLGANIRLSDLPADAPERGVALLALELFGAAVVAGLVGALVGKRRPQLANLLLAIHVVGALAALFAALSFARDVSGA